MIDIKSLKIRIAKWLVPDVFREFRTTQTIIYNLHEVNRVIGKEIPEVRSTLNWVFGRSYSSSKDAEWVDKNRQFIEDTYPEASKYPSLVRFRDVLVNDYNTKRNPK